MKKFLLILAIASFCFMPAFDAAATDNCNKRTPREQEQGRQAKAILEAGTKISQGAASEGLSSTQANIDDAFKNCTGGLFDAVKGIMDSATNGLSNFNFDMGKFLDLAQDKAKDAACSAANEGISSLLQDQGLSLGTATSMASSLNSISQSPESSVLDMVVSGISVMGKGDVTTQFGSQTFWP